MADLHIGRAIGALREGEEQATDHKHAEQIRDIRKRIESAIASNQPIPDVSPELNVKVAEMIDLLRKNPKLCPSCLITGRKEIQQHPEVEHV